jgi:hypothetical protein
MQGRTHRIAGAAGFLILGVIAGTVITDRPAAVAADDPALAAQVAQLMTRVQALEDAKDKPLKAPFSVVDAAGKEILHVDSQNGQGILALLGSPGSIWLRAGSDLSIEAANSVGSAIISVDGEGSTLKVGNPSGSVLIGSQNGPAIEANDGSEQVLSLSGGGSGPQFTVKKGDKSVALTAQASNTGLLVKDADREYQTGDIENIRGFAAYKARVPLGGLGAIESDKFRVVIYNGTNPVFLGGYDRNGRLGLFLSDEGGTDVASVEASDAGGQLRLKGPGSKDIALLGAPEGGGEGGALSLLQGGNKVSLGYGGGAGASLVFGEGGEEAFSIRKDGDGGKLTLGKSDRSVVLKTSGGQATLQASSGSRTTQMGVTQKSTGFVIGESAKPLAALADNGDNKPFLRIYDGGGSKPVLAAGYEANGRPAFRLGDPAKPMALLQQADAGGGELSLFSAKGGQPAVNLGIGQTGRAGVRVYESGGGSAAIMGVTEDGDGAVQVYKGGMAAAGIESDEGGGLVFTANGGRDTALIKGQDGSGAVAIFNAAGSNAVRLVNTGNGGSMVISDTGGGDVLEARADPAVGGLVCVNYKNVEKCLGRGLTGLEGFH